MTKQSRLVLIIVDQHQLLLKTVMDYYQTIMGMQVARVIMNVLQSAREECVNLPDFK